jgi:integrase/recombinase XerD
MEQQVEMFLEHLVHEHRRVANTIVAYRNDLLQFVHFLGHQATPPVQEWGNLQEKVIDAYVCFLKEHPLDYTSSTVARKLATIKRFCDFLADAGWLADNVAKPVRLPKVVKPPSQPLRADEIAKLLAEPAQCHSPYALRDRALLETLYATGMRVSELVGLDLHDVDLAHRQIHCGIDDKRSRTVKLNAEAAAALHDYLCEGRLHLLVDRNEAALFLNHRGQRLTRQGLWLIIKRYVKEVGIKTAVTPHTLRHSFAIHLLNTGVAPQEIKERLGYAHLNSTQRYQPSANVGLHELIIDGKPLVRHE